MEPLLISGRFEDSIVQKEPARLVYSSQSLVTRRGVAILCRSERAGNGRSPANFHGDGEARLGNGQSVLLRELPGI
jgi:hypothetical protein